MTKKGARVYDMKRGKPAHFVYAITCQQYVKLGISSQPFNRLANMQTANPMELKLVWLMSFNKRSKALAYESGLHELFRGRHVRGEWFELSCLDSLPDAHFTSEDTLDYMAYFLKPTKKEAKESDRAKRERIRGKRLAGLL